MIDEKTKQKVKILAFWDKYGTQATEDAYKVKRRTLYLKYKGYKQTMAVSLKSISENT